MNERPRKPGHTVARGRIAVANQTIATREGLDLADPHRADKALRRFSWQEDEAKPK